MVSARESICSAGAEGASAPAERDLLQARVRCAQSGDAAAQAELINRYRVRVAGLVRPMLRDRETVKDVVQKVSVKMLRRLPSLRDPANFEAWLFTMARNAALDEIRRARCRPFTVPGDSLEEYTAAPVQVDRSDEVMEAVRLAVASWKGVNRRILDHLLAGLSYQAVAEREGLSVGAVKLRIHRFRRLLRSRIGAALTHGEASPTDPLSAQV